MRESQQRRRALRSQIKDATERRNASLRAGERDLETLMEIQREIHRGEQELLILESEALFRKAERYAIEIPLTPSWWWDDSVSGLPPEDVSRYLTKVGQVGVKKLIRDERRNNIEWWLKVAGLFITLLTGLLGTLIGVIALLKD